MSSTTKLAIILLCLILSFLLGALVVQVAYGAPEDGYPPPGTRVVILPCVAAGYPAGWGPGCTVHRVVSERRVSTWRIYRLSAR